MEPNLQPNPLETDPIPKLIVRYAVPTSLTLMVNYLYNIVDQIFVGQGVGITGMAATNIAFPLTILVNAVALMLGDGCAANISLCLGRKEQREADSTISHALTLILASGLLAALACGIFAPQIVVLFRRDVDCLCRVSVLICAPSHGDPVPAPLSRLHRPLSGRTAPRST